MKSLFNFYLDDDDKKKASEKLERIFGQQCKGLLAAYYRVMTEQLINTPDDKLQVLMEHVAEDYVYNTKRNKRSKL